MSQAPIITRVAITRPEYDALRKRAIDAGVSTSEYLARLVRKDAPQGKGEKQG